MGRFPFPANPDCDAAVRAPKTRGAPAPGSGTGTGGSSQEGGLEAATAGHFLSYLASILGGEAGRGSGKDLGVFHFDVAAVEFRQACEFGGQGGGLIGLKHALLQPELAQMVDGGVGWSGGLVVAFQRVDAGEHLCHRGVRTGSHSGKQAFFF